jgi:hypothetical protein
VVKKCLCKQSESSHYFTIATIQNLLDTIDWNKIDCWTSWQVHAELHKWGFVRKWLSFLKLKRSFFDVLKYNMQDETNHLFPQANGTRIMSTSQTIQTWTAIFLDFLFFIKFEQSRGEEELFFFLILF